MRTVYRSILLFTLSLQMLHAQPEIVAKFVSHQQPYAGGSLTYLLFVPEQYDSTRHYPLMLALHGSTETYSFDWQFRDCRYATVWADPVNQTDHPSFVVAPVCPSGGDWSAVYGGLLAILDSLERAFSIDTDRVYITGISMGGFGTWGMITHYPELFAAAVPMAAGGAPAYVNSFATMPIWDFHSAADPVVAVALSREMIHAMEEQGRTVVFTHCHGADARCLPDSQVAMFVASHADVFYTETATGQHDTAFFNFAYNFKYLVPWVFDKHRLSAGAVALTNLNAFRTLSGATSVTWSGGAPTDSLELWFSPDAGRSWQLLERSVPNTGAYLWNTTTVEDCGLGLVNIFLKDEDGHIYGRNQSSLFAINNPGNGAPSISLARNLTLTSRAAYSPDTLSVIFRANDPEGDMLHVSILYSYDYGSTFAKIDSFVIASDSLPHARLVSLWSEANSTEAVLAIEASDGSVSAIDRTTGFIKQTMRGRPPEPSLTMGGTVWVNIIEAARLTNDLYRLVFTESAEGKWYDVLDVSKGEKAISRAMAPFDGITEGPLFDGMRLVVKDYAQPEADVAGSHWEIGSSKYHFSFSVPAINMEGTMIYGVPYGADYRITISGSVVDTSSAAIFGADRILMKFKVENIADNRKSEIVFVDGDANGALSPQDEVYILETDSLGHPMLTWGMEVKSFSPADAPPVPGDVFVFKTHKPIKNNDTYEFRGAVVGVTQRETPASFRLYQNYPNPFNPKTGIRFQVSDVSDVKLVVYDLLGRKVLVLVDERKAPGIYEVGFDASGLASGVYFYRMQAGTFMQTKKLMLIR